MVSLLICDHDRDIGQQTTMGTFRGILNPTTACHVTSSLAVLCHCLAPIREAILRAGRTSAITERDADPVCRELARFLEEYYVTGDDVGDYRILPPAEIPDNLYRVLLAETGIQAENVGDAVTTLAKILDHLRRSAAAPEIARIVKATVDGSCHRVILDGHRRKILPQRSMPCPFPVRIEGDPTALSESLQQTLEPKLVYGYQWMGEFEVLSSGPSCEQSCRCDTTKTMLIDQAPPVWIIHLDRVERGSHKRQDVNIPMVDAPMSFDASSLGISAEYRLMGSVVLVSDFKHAEGEEDAGHTIAVIRGQRYDDGCNGNDPMTDWIVFDDETVSSISDNEAHRMINGCQTDRGMAEGVLLVYHQLGWRWRDLLQNEVHSAETQQSTLTDVDWARPTMLIGRRVQVKWAQEKWYKGTVSSYDCSTRKHTVTYDDGDTRSYNLQRKTIEWL